MESNIFKFFIKYIEPIGDITLQAPIAVILFSSLVFIDAFIAKLTNYFCHIHINIRIVLILE